MKKAISLALSAVMAISMAACSKTETPKTNTVKEVNADVTKNADIIIVGAGGGGLAAAIEAVDSGAESVIIIEKTGKTGGSLNFTSGSMSGAETIIQEIDGVEDTKESYVQDILANGAHLGNEELIRTFVDEDVDAIQWLWDNGLKDYKFSSLATSGKRSVFAPEHQLYSVMRTYKPSANDPSKYKCAAHEILDTVLATEAYKNIVTIDFYTTATELVNNEQGQVLTVVAKDGDGNVVRYDANKAVIMTTGGYSGNLTMMANFAEHGGDYLVGGASTADGYGIYMMQEIGADINETSMSYIPTFPMGLDTGKPGTPGLIASSYMWKCGAISVNREGKRFANETSADVVLRETALEEQTNAIQYDIFTDKIISDVEELGASVFWNFYYKPGAAYNYKVVEADSIAELAEKLGIPADALEATVADYNAHVESGETDELGREFTEESITNNSYSVAINKIEGEKYYAIPLKALVVMTLGGVTVNTDGQVLDNNGTVIPGLYAAGECVGGVWGKFVSGGTGVMGPIVFGRLAARHAMTNELSADTYLIQPSEGVITPDMFAKAGAEGDKYDMTKTFTDGEYTAEVDGQEGKMTVKVTIAGGKISAVEIVENHETQSIAGNALEKLPQAIVDANSPDVDGVSGATLTSGRIMSAVKLCLDEASK